MTTMLTKKEVEAYCWEVFKQDPATFRHDVCAKRQFFNDFTDMLCKDKQITPKQYHSWVNPF